MSINEFRVALTCDDFDAVIAFYRDGLGLDPGEVWTGNGTGQMFFAGRGILEIFDVAYAKSVDEIEVGKKISGQIRFAFQVTDVFAAVERAVDYGATLIHEPVLTPWNDLNARMQSPDGMQITLFEVKAID
jgi:catechol 2,3-dioxygenase-like lactoylglutathione lyase family enzyme